MTDKLSSNEPPGRVPDEADAEGSGKLELPVALEPTVEEQAAAAPAEAEAVSPDPVSRFIADLGTDPEELPQEALEEDDAPTLAYNGRAMAGLDTTRRSIPPALPPEATMPSHPDDLPNVMLGPALSTRGDPTERIEMPRTHPLANSLAPGGSPVSVPPARRDAPRRWPLAIGAVAMIALGASGAFLLQTRGEHHARSRSASTSHAARQAPTPMPAEPAMVERGHPAPETIAAGPAAHTSAGDPRAVDTAATPANATVATIGTTSVNEAASAPAVRPQPMRVAMGAARMQPGPRPAMALPNGDLAREKLKVALGGYHARVRACVGDAHGIADVALTVQHSGIVSHALVEGTFAGSPAGSCIARTLRSVRLPPIGEPSVRVTYPFRL